MGGRLVTVNDDRTNRFLIDTLNDLPWSNSGVWIGLHDRGRELHWRWSTESQGKSASPSIETFP